MSKDDTWVEYLITAQRAEDSNDPRGTQDFEGDNFSNLVDTAQRAGYPRIIGGRQRRVSAWTPIEDYTFDKVTP